MTDVMEQLRGAQPMPRGERLARNRNVPAPKPPRLIQRCSQPLAMAWFTDDMETHAAPLALARERRRRERAEAWLRITIGMATKEREALRADVARLRAAVPTREDVEAALQRAKDARDHLMHTPHVGEQYMQHVSAALAAEEALVALATRGTG